MRKRWKLAIFFSVLAVGTASSVWGLGKVVVSSVVCKTTSGECPQGVTDNFSGIVGQPLFGSKAKLVQRLEQDALVNAFSISYKLPNSLVVDVDLRKASYALWATGYKDAAIVDRSGVVLGYSNSPGLPTIVVESTTPPVGEVVPESMRKASYIYAKVALLHPISGAVLSQDYLAIQLADSYQVIFPLDSDTDVVVGSLALLLARLNSPVQEFTIDSVSTIDLRFNNPVLK